MHGRKELLKFYHAAGAAKRRDLAEKGRELGAVRGRIQRIFA